MFCYSNSVPGYHSQTDIQDFAHAIRAQLSWHVQNFCCDLVTTVLSFGNRKQNRYKNLNFKWNIVAEMDPLVVECTPYLMVRGISIAFKDSLVCWKKYETHVSLHP